MMSYRRMKQMRKHTEDRVEKFGLTVGWYLNWIKHHFVTLIIIATVVTGLLALIIGIMEIGKRKGFAEAEKLYSETLTEKDNEIQSLSNQPSPTPIIQLVEVSREPLTQVSTVDLWSLSDTIPVNGNIITDETEFISKFNLLTKSSITEDELNLFLAGTELANLGPIFKKAEENTGINAVFLTSMACLESGYGSSQIAHDKNNLFGWGASDDNPYENAYSYNNYADCIIRVSNVMKNSYFSIDGRYFHGTTLDDGTVFVSIENVNESYCSLESWEWKIADIMLDIANSTTKLV